MWLEIEKNSNNAKYLSDYYSLLIASNDVEIVEINSIEMECQKLILLLKVLLFKILIKMKKMMIKIIKI